MLKARHKVGFARRLLAVQRLPSHRTFSALVYSDHGQPEDVLELRKTDERDPGPKEVLVDWLAVSLSIQSFACVQ